MVAVDWDGDGKVDLLVGHRRPRRATGPTRATLPVEQSGRVQPARWATPATTPQGLWRGRGPGGPHPLDQERWRGPGSPRFEAPTRPRLRRRGPPPPGPPTGARWRSRGGAATTWNCSSATPEGLVKIHRNFGGQRPPVLMEPRTLKQGGEPLLVPEDRTVLIAADLDGDRRTELVGGMSDGRVFAIRSTSRDAASAPSMLAPAEPGPLWLRRPRGRHRRATSTAMAGSTSSSATAPAISPGLKRFLGRGPEHRYGLPAPIEAGGMPFRSRPRARWPTRRAGRPPARPRRPDPGRLDGQRPARPNRRRGGGGSPVPEERRGRESAPVRPARPRSGARGRPLILPPRVRPAVGGLVGARAGWTCWPWTSRASSACSRRVDERGVGAPIPLVDRLGRVIRLDGGFRPGWAMLALGGLVDRGRPGRLAGRARPADAARFVVPPLIGRAIAGGRRRSPPCSSWRTRGRWAWWPGRSCGWPTAAPWPSGPRTGAAPPGSANPDGGGLDLLVGVGRRPGPRTYRSRPGPLVIRRGPRPV